MTRVTRLIAGVGILAMACSSVAIARSHGIRDGKQAKRFERMVRELNLDSTQKERATEIEDRRIREVIAVDAKTRLAEQDLRKLMRSSAPDRDALLAQVEALGRLRTDKKKIQISARLDQRELLTPEQRTKLDSLREERRERRSERRGKPGRDKRHERNEGEERPDRDDDRDDER